MATATFKFSWPQYKCIQVEMVNQIDGKALGELLDHKGYQKYQCKMNESVCIGIAQCYSHHSHLYNIIRKLK